MTRLDNKYEGSGSSKLGPGTFEESRSTMTFLTNLGVTRTLNSFRLVLERKRYTLGKDIPWPSRLMVLEKISAKNFDLFDPKSDILEPLNRGRYRRFTFVENTISIAAKLRTAQSLGIDRRFSYLHMEVKQLQRTFARIASLSGLRLRNRRLILLLIKKYDMHELWQQYKQVKTMTVDEPCT